MDVYGSLTVYIFSAYVNSSALEGVYTVVSDVDTTLLRLIKL